MDFVFSLNGDDFPKQRLENHESKQWNNSNRYGRIKIFSEVGKWPPGEKNENPKDRKWSKVGKLSLTQPMDPEKKSLNFIFPTKYVIPKSLKFCHWLSEFSRDLENFGHKTLTSMNISQHSQPWAVRSICREVFVVKKFHPACPSAFHTQKHDTQWWLLVELIDDGVTFLSRWRWLIYPAIPDCRRCGASFKAKLHVQKTTAFGKFQRPWQFSVIGGWVLSTMAHPISLESFYVEPTALGIRFLEVVHPEIFDVQK